MAHLNESSAVRLEELKWIWNAKSKVWNGERWDWVRYILTGRGVVPVYAKGRKETPRALARVWDQWDAHAIKIAGSSGAESGVLGSMLEERERPMGGAGIQEKCGGGQMRSGAGRMERGQWEMFGRYGQQDYFLPLLWLKSSWFALPFVWMK